MTGIRISTPQKARRRMRAATLNAPAAGSNGGWIFLRSAGLSILQSSALNKQKWLVHGFSTRLGGASLLTSAHHSQKNPVGELNLGFTESDVRSRVDENRRRLLKGLGAPEMKLVPLRQFHSDVLHVIEAQPHEPLRGDALVTSAPNLLLAVQTADCVPILLADPRNRVVAAIHAGWRGTLKRIAEKTVGRMRMVYGTRPSSIVAALGPAIRRCCYEVGPEVVKEFASQFSDSREWFDGPFNALVSGEDPNPLPWLSMMPPGHKTPTPRALLDLQAANRANLEAAGVPAKNIFTSRLCTSCRTDLFFSYRREKTSGRLMACIGIR